MPRFSSSCSFLIFSTLRYSETSDAATESFGGVTGSFSAATVIRAMVSKFRADNAECGRQATAPGLRRTAAAWPPHSKLAPHRAQIAPHPLDPRSNLLHRGGES